MPAKTEGSLTPQAKGGLARKDSLSPSERSEIARKAAEARWAMPQAMHSGTLKLGDAEIPCYVLENGERILSTRGIMKSLRRRWRGRKYTGTQLPVFLEAKNLKPFLANDLAAVSNPVVFRTDRGATAEGYRAEILPIICQTYLKARDEGALTSSQYPVAAQCDILIRGLAHTGIIALVDEATGYQEVRDRQALQAILDKFLRTEFAAWAKRFPDEFYRQIFRLKGWEWMGMKRNRPQLVGKYTNDLVYNRLAPGVHDELRHRNPKDERGYRKAKHHQWLTGDIGHPRLAEHLYGLIGLMRTHDDGDWQGFKKRVDRAYPPRGSNLDMFTDP